MREPWKPGQSGNPKGRPKSRVPEALAKILGSKRRASQLREQGITATEARQWENIVFSADVDTLKVIVRSEVTPAWPKGLAVAVLTDMKDGTTKTLDKVREWQFGKAAQALNISGELKGPEPLTIEIIDNREQVDNTTSQDSSE